jgi:hypothetical protein
MVWPLALPLILGQLARSIVPILRAGKFADAWTTATVEELTDPLSFIIGAIAIVLSSERDDVAFFRLTASGVVLAGAAVIPVIGAIFTGIFNPVAYGIAAFAAGAATLIPDRIGELRKAGRLGSSDYPVKLKAIFGAVEYLLIVVAGILIGVWGFSGRPHHTILAGIAWGLGTAAALDVLTLMYCIVVGGSGVMVNALRAALQPSLDPVAEAAASEDARAHGVVPTGGGTNPGASIGQSAPDHPEHG